MTDDAPAPAADLPGRLSIADTVFEKIALRAALDVDGVVRDGGSVTDRLAGLVGLDSATGANYPKARVQTAGGRPIVVDVDLAVRWPCPVSAVCRQVRSHVADELERLAGDRPARVNVAVAAVLPGAAVARRRQGFVELPAPGRAEPAATGTDEGTSDDDD